MLLFNEMNARDKFALVPRPPGALEKAEPGARRIMSGMVADTLALVKKDSPEKPAFTALLGLDIFAGCIELILRSKLGGIHNLRFHYFARSSELLKLAEEHLFDLVFMYMGNITWDIASAGGPWARQYGILGELKARYGKPIVVTHGYDLSQIGALSAELEPKGVIFLSIPYTVENLWTHLQPQLGAPVNGESSKQWCKQWCSVAICGISPGHELETLICTTLQNFLGAEYVITLHFFPHARQWEETLDPYNLLVIFLNPVLRNPQNDGEVDAVELVAELKSKSQRPVIVLTNGSRYGLDCSADFEQAGADGFFSFLPPFPTELFKQALKHCAAKSLTLRAQAAQPRARPVRIVLVDHEEALLECLGPMIRDWFKDATLVEFSNSSDAWQELSRADPDLLITGYVMPGLTGEEIVGRLVERKVNYPIVVMSGYGPAEPEQWVKDYAKRGLNVTFLAKSFSAEQLYAELAKHFGAGENPPRQTVKDAL